MHGVLRLLMLCSAIHYHITMAQVEKKIITFNTALQFSIPMKEQRRQQLEIDLLTSDADVVCLQEVYHGSDIAELSNRLLETFPYIISFNKQLVNEVTKQPECKDNNVFQFLECSSSRCSGYDMTDEYGVIGLMRCLHSNCALPMLRMPQSCLTCFFLFPNSTEALNVCFNPETEINVEGLVLLSKTRYLTVNAAEHHPGVMEIAKQGYLSAMIETIGTVVCTHLATNFLKDLYPEDFLSYGGYVSQNLAEVYILLEAFKDIKPLILAGDFNTGPELPDKGVCEYNPDSYKVLTSADVDLEHTILDKCTYCKENTWSHEMCDLTIDHVFVRGLTLKGIERIFDVHTVTPEWKRLYISDHYGLMATFVADQ